MFNDSVECVTNHPYFQPKSGLNLGENLLPHKDVSVDKWSRSDISAGYSLSVPQYSAVPSCYTDV